jgi:hypothetical protein
MISLLQFSVKIDSQGLLVIAFVTVYVVYSEIWGRHTNFLTARFARNLSVRKWKVDEIRNTND